jgi:hypothetical protein
LKIEILLLAPSRADKMTKEEINQIKEREKSL